MVSDFATNQNPQELQTFESRFGWNAIDFRMMIYC